MARRSRAWVMGVVATSVAATSVSASITLQAGSVLATDRTNNVLRQYDPATGAEIGSVQLSIDAQRRLEGVTLVGTDVYVSYGSTSFPSLRQIARIDLRTGASIGTFAAGDSIGLATRAGDLLSLARGSGSSASVQRYTNGGSLVSTATLATAPVLGLNEFIDDVAWDGSAFATVSNFRQPGVGAFQIYRWNAQNGQWLPPGTTLFYPALGMLAEGFDIAPTDGAFWFTFNPTSGPGGSFIERYNPATGQRTRFQTATGALSDVAFVPVPGPGVLSIFALAGTLASGRRRAGT